MRKTILYILSLLALGSCVDSNIGFDSQDQEAKLTICGTIDQLYTTKADDGGFCDDDAVGIFAVNYNGSVPGTLLNSGNQVDNVKYIYDESTNTWSGTEDAYFYGTECHADIYGYYPYISGISSINNYPFEVAKDQSKAAANGALSAYEASDFLWACTPDVAPTTGVVDLLFKHRMGSIKVSLEKGDGWEDGEWESADKQVLIPNTIRESEIDMSSGMVSPRGDIGSAGIIPQRCYGDNWRAIIVPQTVEAGLETVIITINGQSKGLVRSGEYVYYPGKLNSITLKVDRNSSKTGIDLSVYSEGILDWENDLLSHDSINKEYLFLEIPTAGSLQQVLKDSGCNIAEIQNLKLAGFLDSIDFMFIRDSLSSIVSLNLKDVKITDPEDEIPQAACYGLRNLTHVVFPDGIRKIGNFAFSWTNLSGSLIFPDSVTEIGTWAFDCCKALNGTLELPRNLSRIGDGAFTECYSLRGSLLLPETLTYIGSGAFNECHALSGQLSLPDGLETLGSSAFMNCYNLSGTLTIPHGITRILDNCFNGCYGFQQLVLHDGIESVGLSAFANCSKMTGELALPDKLTNIASYAFSNTSFTSISFGEGIESIGAEAFADNSVLTGNVSIPNKIDNIPQSLFQGCPLIQSIMIPASVTQIGSSAFANCYGITSIVCEGTTPPEVGDGAFDGVAKDNFAVQVPESAVTQYASASGWSEFRRISAYRDFSISRRLARALNAGTEYGMVLRAPSGMSWHVSSKPDWVEVTPSSGTGKADVSVTVSELSGGSGNRTGEVVYELDGKDCQVSTTVEQYDYSYGDGDCITLMEHSKGSGVNLVFLGDCYDAKDISEGKYLQNIQEAVTDFFSIEPYSTYRDYFDVYAVIGKSEDSGVGTASVIRDARFGSAYTVSEGLRPDMSTCFEYACKAPIGNDIAHTLVTLVLNTTDYGGITYMYGDGSAVSVCPMSGRSYPYDFRGIVQHEAGGHGFGKLGDEYIYHNAFIQSCGCACCEHVDEFKLGKSYGWYDNLSLTGDMHTVPWSHLIFDDKYSDLVDVYEGGFYHTRGVFRSEQTSCMNNNIAYYSTISRESIVKRIMEYAGETYSYDDFKAKDSMLATKSVRRTYGDMAWPSSPVSHNAPVIVGEHPDFKGRR